MIPPPNVTGSLHIGHALDHTIQDVLIRRQRMQGYEALWLPGMDHAGIATQNVVERQLAGRGHDPPRPRPRGVRRAGLGVEGRVRRRDPRPDAPARRLAWTGAASGSPWTRACPAPSQTIFKRLYDDGLIYRAERIINWCPRCLTALSDIEVEHTDDEGELVSHPLRRRRRRDRGGHHPGRDDARRHRGGGAPRRRALPRTWSAREVELPLTGRRIPIVADDARRPGVRHRRGQGDPGARPERLRDRPAARPAEPDRSWTSAA